MIEFIAQWNYVFLYASVMLGAFGILVIIARIVAAVTKKAISEWSYISRAGKNVREYVENRNEYNRWKHEQNREN